MKWIVTIDDKNYDVELDRYGDRFVLMFNGNEYDVRVIEVSPSLFCISIDEASEEIFIEEQEGIRLWRAGRVYNVNVERKGLKAIQRTKQKEETTSVTAPIPGKVIKVMVNKGENVKKGSALLMLEAMKMENELISPRDGTVLDVLVEEESTVEAGVPLLIIGDPL